MAISFFASLGAFSATLDLIGKVLDDIWRGLKRLRDGVDHWMFGMSWEQHQAYLNACHREANRCPRHGDYRLIADCEEIMSMNKFFGGDKVIPTTSSLPPPTEELRSEYWKQKYQTLQDQIHKQNGVAIQTFNEHKSDQWKVAQQASQLMNLDQNEIPQKEPPKKMSESAKLRAETKNLTALQLWEEASDAEYELERPKYIERLEAANKKLGRPNRTDYSRMETMDIQNEVYDAEFELERPEYLRRLAKARGINYVEEGREEEK